MSAQGLGPHITAGAGGGGSVERCVLVGAQISRVILFSLFKANLTQRAERVIKLCTCLPEAILSLRSINIV